MQSRSGGRNNLLAGGFLLTCLVLAIATSFILSDVQSRMVSSHKYHVLFTLEQGAVGLKTGSSVLLAGQKIGRVVSVTIAKQPIAGPQGEAAPTPVGIDVLIAIRSDIVLYENASFNLERPLLGSITTINISAVGSPAQLVKFDGASPQLEEGETVLGSLAPPGFLSQAGLGPDQIKQVRQIIADSQLAVSKLTKLLEQNGPTIERSINDVGEITKSVREKWPQWAGSVDKIAGNVETASGRLDGILVNADTGVADAKAALTELRDILAQNHARVDSILANIESITDKVDDQSIALANDALKDGRSAMVSLKSTTERADALLAEQTPNIRRTLANARLASDQLKLTMAEIRAAPWRVLFRPSTKEQQTEILYDAVRAYAVAVSDLRAAGESLESAAGSDGSPQALDRATLEQLSQELRDKFSKYQTAEQTLFDRLVKQTGGTLPVPAAKPADSPESH